MQGKLEAVKDWDKNVSLKVNGQWYKWWKPEADLALANTLVGHEVVVDLTKNESNGKTYYNVSAIVDAEGGTFSQPSGNPSPRQNAPLEASRGVSKDKQIMALAYMKAWADCRSGQVSADQAHLGLEEAIRKGMDVYDRLFDTPY